MTKFPLPSNQKEPRGWLGLCNQLSHYVPALSGEQSEFRKLLKKNVAFTVTEKMFKEEEFEAEKAAIWKNIILNAFDVTRRTLVITDASGEGLRHILMQKRNASELQVKTRRMNRSGWLGIQVGSVALKPAWRNYSELELEATCVVWSLETWAYYLKWCPRFDLWTDHSPLAQAMKKEVRELTPRMQKFRRRSRPTTSPYRS